MTQITIDIPNQSDTNWIIKLLERLHLDFRISADQPTAVIEKTELERNREIIARGSSMTSAEAGEMLEWLKEQRKDRKLPFRD
jgi:hypothetical protein